MRPDVHRDGVVLDGASGGLAVRSTAKVMGFPGQNRTERVAATALTPMGVGDATL